MSLESGNYITDLVPTNPASTDPVSQGDDHLQLIKKCVQQSFPNIDAAVTLTPAQINALPGQVAALVPVGTLLDFAGTVVPAGFLACDGAPVSRTTYAALFTAIGITWGPGDTTTTFNVPDFKRRAAVGSGGTLTPTLGNLVGNVGGAETHVLTIPEIPAHSHQFETGTAGAGGTRAQHVTPSDAFNTIQTLDTGGGLAHNNMQPSAVVLKIIKT